MALNILTSNESFHKLHKNFKKHGIQNNDFMLKLYDPNLLGIDPLSNGISKRMKERIREEVSKNIWYYFQEFVYSKIPGGDLKRFELTKQSAAQIYLSTINQNQWITSYRQSRKTSVALDILVWYLFVKMYCDRMKVDIIHPSSIPNGTLFWKMREKIMMLPDYIMGLSQENRFLQMNQNIRELSLGSYSESQEDAYMFGKQLTADLVYIDDAEYIPHLDCIISGIQDRDKAYNRKTSVMITSAVAPHVVASRNGVLNLLNDKFSNWNDSCYDQEKEKSDGKFGCHVQYDWKELGKDEVWYNEMKQILDDPSIVKREIDCIRGV